MALSRDDVLRRIRYEKQRRIRLKIDKSLLLDDKKEEKTNPDATKPKEPEKK